MREKEEEEEKVEEEERDVKQVWDGENWNGYKLVFVDAQMSTTQWQETTVTEVKETQSLCSVTA